MVVTARCHGQRRLQQSSTMTARGGNISSNATGADDDPVLLALEDLVRAAGEIRKAAELMTARADHIRACRGRGAPYRDIVTGGEHPLIAGMLTETIQRFQAAGTRFRRAEARALHREGLTMEQIAELFGLTRQRISVLLRDPSAAVGSTKTSE